MFAEKPVKRARCSKSAVIGYVGHVHIRFYYKLLCSVKAVSGKVRKESHTGDFLENMREIVFGKIAVVGNLLKRYSMGVVFGSILLDKSQKLHALGNKFRLLGCNSLKSDFSYNVGTYGVYNGIYRILKSSAFLLMLFLYIFNGGQQFHVHSIFRSNNIFIQSHR